MISSKLHTINCFTGRNYCWFLYKNKIYVLFQHIWLNKCTICQGVNLERLFSFSLFLLSSDNFLKKEKEKTDFSHCEIVTVCSIQASDWLPGDAARAQWFPPWGSRPKADSFSQFGREKKNLSRVWFTKLKFCNWMVQQTHLNLLVKLADKTHTQRHTASLSAPLLQSAPLLTDAFSKAFVLIKSAARLISAASLLAVSPRSWERFCCVICSFLEIKKSFERQV